MVMEHLLPQRRFSKNLDLPWTQSSHMPTNYWQSEDIMIIAVACDHAGFPLKDEVIEVIQQTGNEVLDLGTYSLEPVDYPDYAEKAGRAILQGQADRAIILCGSGVGASIAANKMHGIYASVCHDTYSAHQAVEHDNMNVLCLGGRVIGGDLAKEIVKSFLGAKFTNEERHKRRVSKIVSLENFGMIKNGKNPEK
jgi:RpiB/LacA/LacB family sugar-phosphate isomerase